jgi:hypothetical protein
MHFINLSPGKVLHPPKPFPRKESNFDSVLKVAGMNMRKSGKRESGKAKTGAWNWKPKLGLPFP